MKITDDSHTDHAITPEQMEYIMAKFGHRDAFFIETVDLPPRLGTVPCGLHGPIMGDEAVPESEVSYSQRGEREGDSRMCDRPARQVSQVTLIAGPHEDEPCILYTAFGGPLAPKEPTDPTIEEKDLPASKEFWGQHALTK